MKSRLPAVCRGSSSPTSTLFAPLHFVTTVCVVDVRSRSAIGESICTSMSKATGLLSPFFRYGWLTHYTGASVRSASPP